MPFTFPPRCALARGVVFGLCGLALGGVTRAAADTQSAMEQTQPAVALANLIDRLPDLLDLGLPWFAPAGAVQIYSHPRFGDFLHEDYFRLPVDVRVKVKDNIELNGELGSYFTNGFHGYVGNGFYEVSLGVKRETVLSPDAGWSAGLNFVTPVSRPPIEITDGVRHLLPYVTLTHTLVPRWGLVGFATFGADLIAQTNLPENFRKNEFHDDSLILTLGVAREWHRLQFILTTFDANTTSLGDREKNVFGVRPSVGIPVLRRHDGTARATVTFEGRTIWGPDGFETGVTTSVRVDFRYRRTHDSR